MASERRSWSTSVLLLFVPLHRIGTAVGSWDLPDAGGGQNIPAVKEWALKRITTAENNFAATGKTREPSPSDWADAIVYSVQVDRFLNSNKSNDLLNVLPWQRQHMTANNLDGLHDWRHGGDIQGVRDRLGYMKDLGVDTIWLSPVLDNTGDYHGYCTTDPTRVDPGFGTNEDFRDMVAEAHQLGMRVVLDIVVNHMCDTSTTYYQSPDHTRCASELNRKSWNGEPGGSSAQGQLAFSSTFFPPFKVQDFFNRCGPNTHQETQGEMPPTVFGDFVGGKFDYDTRNWDLQELLTNIHKFWIAYADIDGFRLDAAKHITEDFIAHFTAETHAYATSLGKRNFLVLGEVAASASWMAHRLGRMMVDPARPNTQGGRVSVSLVNKLQAVKHVYLANSVYPAPGLNSVYNFVQSGKAKNWLFGSTSSRDLATYFSSKEYVDVILQDLGSQPASQQWSVMEIHDWTRFASHAPNDIQFALMGLVTLFTMPGVPVVYYGQEQGFTGKCPSALHAGNSNYVIERTCNAGTSDGLKRQDMFVGGPWRLQSVIPEVSAQAHVGLPPSPSPAQRPWQDDPMIPRNHAVYRTARGLAALRRSCRVFSQGHITFHRSSWTSGSYMAYSRALPQSRTLAIDVEALVVVNPGGEGEVILYELPLNIRLPIGATLNFRNVMNTQEVASVLLGSVVQFAGGLRLPPRGFAIYMREDVLLPFNQSLGIAMCNTTAMTSGIDIFHTPQIPSGSSGTFPSLRGHTETTTTTTTTSTTTAATTTTTTTTLSSAAPPAGTLKQCSSARRLGSVSSALIIVARVLAVL